MENDVGMQVERNLWIVGGNATQTANGRVFFSDAETSSAGSPAWAAEKYVQTVVNSVVRQVALRDVQIVTELRLEDVEEFVRLHQTIRYRFILFNERSKHSVPDNEHASVVLVQIFDVSSVVRAMMRRSVENKLNHSIHLSYHLRVDPELVKRIKLFVHQEQAWWHEKGQRQIEDPVKKLLEKPLSSRRRKILCLTPTERS